MRGNDKAFFGVLWILAVILVLVGTPPVLESWLSLDDPARQEWLDFSAFVRNIGLVAVAPFALWLAWRRTSTATRQADTAERGLNVDRYQKGVQMLQSDELAVRVGGIYTLRELAIGDSEDYFYIVLDSLYTFVREGTKENYNRVFEQIPEDEVDRDSKAKKALRKKNLSPDFQAALEAATQIRDKCENALGKRALANWFPDLSGAILFRAKLTNANLENAQLRARDARQFVFGWRKSQKR
jgi:hypothetical protein